MSGLQTKSGHTIGQNSAGKALNRTPRLKTHPFNVEY